MISKLKGVITALITPFKEGKIDFVSLDRLIEQQVKAGVNGFVISGTTGESPTLSLEEKRKIFEHVKNKVPHQFPLIVGTGSNSTQSSVLQSKEAVKWGADAILVVVPYYNKPPQRGLLDHFNTVASSVDIPTILYNVPGRTVASLELGTIKRLSEHPMIIGIKEATGNISFAQQIRNECGESFLLLSGDDGSYDDFMKAGGNGVISVASHIIPEAMKSKNIIENRDLIDLLFVEANPIPIKMALYFMGIIDSPELRLPLVTMEKTLAEKLKKKMLQKGLIQ